MAAPVRYRRRRQGDTFTVPLPSPGKKKDPAILPWHWIPTREGAVPPPVAFDKQLKAIDKDLFVCWSPVHERWLVWVKNPTRHNSVSGYGWQLIFLWEHPETKEYLPLNELIFHNLFLVMRDRFPNASVYFERIQEDIKKAKADRDKTYNDDRQAMQKDYRKSFQISSAGSGSRGAMYDGDVVPSRGDLDWRARTRKHRLPSNQLRQEADQKEQRFYGR